jgi:cytochrome c oxidase subunit 2
MPSSASYKRHFIIVGVLVAVSTVVLGILLNGVLPLPVPAVAQASTVDWLFRVHMWLIAFLFALVFVFMIYSLVVFRRAKREDDGEHFEGNTTLEILWTAIPLVIVVVFAFIGVRTLADVTASSPDELAVGVTGQQWSWVFTYPNGTTNAELVVPVNQPLALNMTSPDVIHSFWVPEWRLKQDLVPGMTTHINYTPTETGEFTLACNQACGLSHTQMYATVRVVTPEEYTAWVTEQALAQGVEPDLAAMKAQVVVDASQQTASN